MKLPLHMEGLGIKKDFILLCHQPSNPNRKFVMYNSAAGQHNLGCFIKFQTIYKWFSINSRNLAVGYDSSHFCFYDSASLSSNVRPNKAGAVIQTDL